MNPGLVFHNQLWKAVSLERIPRYELLEPNWEVEAISLTGKQMKGSEPGNACQSTLTSD